MAAALQDIAEIFFLDFVYVPDLLAGDDLGETSNRSLGGPPQREDFTIPRPARGIRGDRNSFGYGPGNIEYLFPFRLGEPQSPQLLYGV